jgi:hypothetical protein
MSSNIAENVAKHLSSLGINPDAGKMEDIARASKELKASRGFMAAGGLMAQVRENARKAEEAERKAKENERPITVVTRRSLNLLTAKAS